MRLLLSKSFKEPFKDKHRYLILCGGAGSGKTEFAARKIFYRCQVEGGHRFLVLRKVRSRARESVLEVFLCLLRENEIAFELNKTNRVISWTGPNGRTNEILIDGINRLHKADAFVGVAIAEKEK
jgi:phage terminase large subunit